MSDAKAAGRNTLLVMGFVLLSRVLGVVRDIVLSHLFGQNLTTDIYTAAFRIPDILQYLVAGGALSTVFVPVFTQYWNEGKKREAWKVFGTVLTVVACIAIVLVVLLELAAGPVARLMNPGLGGPKLNETISPEALAARQQHAWNDVEALSRILLPAQWCFFLGGLMMGTLNARQRFLVPSLGPIAYNGAIIFAGVLFGGPHSLLGRFGLNFGIASMCWGALLGAAIGNFLLPIIELTRTGAQWRIGFEVDHPGVKKVGALMLPALLGLSLSQLGFWITGWFTRGEGELSALRNAYNLTQAPIGIFAQASAIVLFPTISAMAAAGQMKEFRREIHHGIRRILFLTVPASLLMAVLAEPIITAIYFNGVKFSAPEVRLAAGALWCYSVGTFAWSAQAVLARGFYAMQNSKTPVIITSAMVFFFVALCFVFRPLMGYRGIAIALSVAGTINMLCFIVTLQRHAGGLSLRRLIFASLRIIAAGLVSSGTAWLFLHFFWHGPQSRTGGLLVTILGGVAALAMYVLSSILLRVPELSSATEMLLALVRRKQRSTAKEEPTP